MRQERGAARSAARGRSSIPIPATRYSQLGLLHLVSGQPRDALQDYTNAVALDPLDDYLHAQRCLALQDLGRLRAKPPPPARPRERSPPRGRGPFVASSWLSDAQGRVDEALRWNEEALKRNPGAADLYADRGNWFLALRRSGRRARHLS